MSDTWKVQYADEAARLEERAQILEFLRKRTWDLHQAEWRKTSGILLGELNDLWGDIERGLHLPKP